MSASPSTAKRASSLESLFTKLREADRAAFIPFVTAGRPTPAETGEVLDMLAETGADLIELGVPFSDPLADGPTIQAASFRAIRDGIGLPETLRILEAFRARHPTPVVLFSYLNPVLRYGVEPFLRDAAEAGAGGVLLTDLPTGADPELESAFASSPLDLIRLVAPTTPAERVREIASSARGFLYYVSRTGVTGEQAALAEGLEREVAAIRAETTVPVAVGFGISTADQAGVVGRVADGVVVGSAIVDRLEREGVAGTAAFVEDLARAVHRAR